VDAVASAPRLLQPARQVQDQAVALGRPGVGRR